MLSAHTLAVSYKSGRVAAEPLVDVDVEVAPGEAVALMGPSGSGKSTLLRVLGGLQKPSRGKVTLSGRQVRTSTGAADPRFAFIHQDYQLVDFLTVRENLRLALEVRQLPLDDGRTERALEAVGLADKAKRLPDALSGGERQRVALARALVVRADVILADEPTGALDRQNSEAVAGMLRGLAENDGVIVVVATHDQNVAALMRRRIVLNDGRAVVEETTP